ncbi:MAG: HesB/IscA family protein [Fimbriimonadaceae bacterium]
MSFPVTLTDGATARVKQLLAKDGRTEAFLRIGVKGGGCSGLEYLLKLDTVRKPTDLAVDIDGVAIVCDPKSAKFLDGSELTYTGNLIGGGFKFENPNAARSCGCGTSFTPKQ